MKTSFKALTAFIVITLILLIALLAGFHRYLNPAAAAHQIWHNAVVLTLDDNNSQAEAIELRHGKITAVGSNSELLALATADTELVDLNGQTVMPGFIEAHGHFPGIGLYEVMENLNSPPIDSVMNIADIQSRLASRVRTTNEGDWVLGMGYDDSLLSEQRHPTRDDLDAVSTEHPIYITHISGHMGVANSAALAVLGIDESSPNPEGGEIRKDSNGQPTGLLTETAHSPVRNLTLKLPLQQQLAVMQSAVTTYAQQGVTTVQNGLAAEAHIGGLAAASRYGLIPQRLMIWPEFSEAIERLDQGKPMHQGNRDKLHVGAIKFVADGSIQGYTGWLKAPYYKQGEHGEHGSNWAGMPATNPNELNSMVSRVHCLGQQVAIHGNGDAAIDQALSAIEQALEECPRDDTRHIIIHAQMSTTAQLQKMARLGISPSFFSAHTYFWGDRHRDIFLGPERAETISPANTALSLGVRFTTHLDAPVVPVDWKRRFSAPVQRITASGLVLGEAEKISALQSLRAMTIDAAWQLFMDDETGSLEVGKHADMVVLSNNPLNTPLADIEVVSTIVGGVEIYHRH